MDGLIVESYVTDDRIRQELFNYHRRHERWKNTYVMYVVMSMILL